MRRRSKDVMVFWISFPSKKPVFHCIVVFVTGDPAEGSLVLVLYLLLTLVPEVARGGNCSHSFLPVAVQVVLLADLRSADSSSLPVCQTHSFSPAAAVTRAGGAYISL